MADWISQYSAALDERDAREQAHKSYIDACNPDTYVPKASKTTADDKKLADTKLADRTAALEQTSPSTAAPHQPAFTTTTTEKHPAQPPTRRKPSAAEPSKGTTSPDLISQLRADLASTQRSRAALESQLQQRQTELTTLTTQSRLLSTQAKTLNLEKRELERKLGDRVEEIRQKQRFLENVHDEMAGLNLELNMAVKRADTVKAENEMLVKRWVEKMGQEAEKMNVESKWE